MWKQVYFFIYLKMSKCQKLHFDKNVRKQYVCLLIFVSMFHCHTKIY